MTTQAFAADSAKDYLGTVENDLAGNMTVLMKTNRYYTDNSLKKTGVSYTVTREWGQVAVERGWASDVDGVLPVVPEPASLTGAQYTALNDGDIMDADGGLYALSEALPYVTLTATGTAFAGPCEVAGWYGSVAAGNITVYDALSATGTPFVPAEATATGFRPIRGAGINGTIEFATGFHAVLTGAATLRIVGRLL